ncbi:MAG: D-cysteine desulfhydrase family protein [Anaerolineae bacterium]|jgi:D-cysteine desulfhydrase family pyridoxal phosphate-dependent enzyme|nr:D-cysteine desulfhydrase family protein [Anaerolineae bacterium]MBT7071774.1 D-cysteine desulfhydrase family protein [Anaerolineae bacterium]MBT7324468.1 D-cysteine desulfhydrase family protein [Anaerolineae bacterium]
MKNPPRLNFAHLPTPIEHLSRLSEHLSAQLYVKRDDQTGLAFGGNKTRKLEFLVAEAQTQGAKTLISAGAAQSNHCRQTAAAAARYGFDCILVLTGDEPDQPSANLLLDKLFGARIVWVTDRNDRDRILQQAYEQSLASGGVPYLVPYGGSSPTGALGYTFALEELMAQDSSFDWIIFATSSGGTHAGLTLGKRLFGFDGQILGISIDEDENWLKSHVSTLASDASALLGEREKFSLTDVQATDAYCKAGYGVLTDLEREAVQLFAKYEGLLLDPVYTGRAAGGMFDLIRKGFFKPTDKVLFWHTGGTPSLFADKYSFEIV